MTCIETDGTSAPHSHDTWIPVGDGTPTATCDLADHNGVPELLEDTEAQYRREILQQETLKHWLNIAGGP